MLSQEKKLEEFNQQTDSLKAVISEKKLNISQVFSAALEEKYWIDSEDFLEGIGYIIPRKTTEDYSIYELVLIPGDSGEGILDWHIVQSEKTVALLDGECTIDTGSQTHRLAALFADDFSTIVLTKNTKRRFIYKGVCRLRIKLEPPDTNFPS